MSANSTFTLCFCGTDCWPDESFANRVEEGIESYTAVVRLIVGSGMEDGQPPRLRSGS